MHTIREVEVTVRLLAKANSPTGVTQVKGMDVVTEVVAPFAGVGHAVRVTVICPVARPAICGT